MTNSKETCLPMEEPGLWQIEVISAHHFNRLFQDMATQAITEITIVKNNI